MEMEKEDNHATPGKLRPVFWLGLALVVITLAVYWQVGGHSFISFDDGLYVYENSRVLRGLTLSNIAWAFTSLEAANWHPLTWLSHMLDVQLYGLNAGGHHISSVVIHAAAAVLLLLLLYRLTGAVWQSALVAALFALHPMHVESVAWVAERKDVLSAFFWFLTLLLYAGYASTRRRSYYLLTLLSFALGLMAKPMLVTLPLVMLLLDGWPLKRGGEVSIRHLGTTAVRPEPHDFARDRLVEGHESAHVSTGSTRTYSYPALMLALVKEKIPFFVLSLLSAAITIYAQGKATAIQNLETIPYGMRIENAAISYVTYMARLLWPNDLAVYYPFTFDLPGWKFVGSAVILVLVTAWVLRVGRRYPFLAVGWLWFLITLAPVIGLVQVGSQAMADRYTYIPYTGLFIMLAWGVPALTTVWPYRRTLHVALAAVALSVLVAVSWQQIGYWRDGVSLFTHALQVTSNNGVAHNSLGITLKEKGDLDGAIAQYRKALAINPYGHESHSHMGVALAEKGELESATGEFKAALAIKPNDYDASNNLGLAYARLGALDAAIQQLRSAIALKPDAGSAHINLGLALIEKGELDAAIRELRQAVALNPASDVTHTNLGAALAGKGDLNAAIGEFQAALAIKPNDFEGHYNLGLALAGTGHRDEAINEFREALRLNPNSVEAQRQLSAVLSNLELPPGSK